VDTKANSQAGYTLLSNGPIIVEDFAAETRFNPSWLLHKYGVVSGMSVIIQGQNRPFGVLGAHTTRRRRFTEDDIHFLQAAAKVLAMAIERKKTEAQLVESNRETEALRQAGAVLSSTLDYEEVLDRILEQIGKVVPHDTAALMLIEGDTTHVFRRRGHSQEGLEAVLPLSFTITATSTFRFMQESGRPLVIPDIEQYDGWVYQPATNWIKSYAATPIHIHGRIIGFLNVNSATPGFYCQADAEYLGVFANQAAVAIDNAHLFKQSETALEDMSTLYRVARLLAQLDNEQEMFELVLSEYLQRLNFSQGGVLIFDQDKVFGTLKARMVGGRLIEPGLRIPVAGNPSYKQLMTTKQAVVIYDAFHDKLLEPVREFSVELGIKSLLLAPIVVRDEVIGTLGADATTSPHQFTEREISLVEAVANQLSIAIENIRLYAEMQRRADQMTALNELGRAIATSLRLSDVYHAFGHHASGLLPYDHMCIALLTGDEIEVVFVAGQDKARAVLPVGSKLSPKNSAIGWVIELSQPLLRHNVAEDSRFAEDDYLGVEGIHSVMIIPLRIKGYTIGIWNIAAQQIGAYTPDDLRLSQTMADQLAVAVENARLYEQAQQEIAERKRVEATLAEERTMLAQRVAEQTADLREVNVELARASRLKDEFLASMSHELRTPLTSILGLSEVLKTAVFGALNERQLKSVCGIEDSGHHLLALINDVLDLSKIEAGKVELQIGSVSVEEVCQVSLQFIKQTAHKKQLKVSFTNDRMVTTIQADERRLKQILVNLLSNAVKFTPEGGEIGLQVQGDEAGQIVNLTVWDTGIGISKEDLARLFQPFVQLDSSLSRQYAGTGLGLVLAQRMVSMHGGSVSVESTPGQGSRFTISLPWASLPRIVETSIAAEPAAAEVGSALEDIMTGEDVPPLILLAEDDYTLSRLFADYLQSLGYRIAITPNGAEALAQSRREKPALILMDVQMPELDGLEATRRLRADADFAAVPIIILTAMAMPGDRERCLTAGANEYLTKPVKLSELDQVIRRQLNQNQVK
jgi:signal transduction histidine kinase/ActR/RegA family two-component response regulator